MAGNFAVRGVIAAVLTPFDSRSVPDAPKAVAYYEELLSAGCNGLNIMGTTGEGVSISLRDRLRFMEALAKSALPPAHLIVGTGASALGDAVELTRAAYDYGFAAALVIPPFYYRDASQDGIARFFAALVQGARPPKASLLLYNFPRMSGITFTPDLVDRIVRECGDAVAGVKDSSNDRQLQDDLRARFPALSIFPGSEEYLLSARERGLDGCISGSVCLWPEIARDVWLFGDAAKAQQLARLRAQLRGASLIDAVRQELARRKDDSDWLRGAHPLESSIP